MISEEIMRQRALDSVRARMDLLMYLYSMLADLENAIERGDAETAATIVLTIRKAKHDDESDYGRL